MAAIGRFSRGGLIAALILAPLALGGCAVSSDTPLFETATAPQHRLATGLWAMSGPGCEVRPNPAGELPGCAVPLNLTDGEMGWDVGAVIARMSGMPMPPTTALPPKHSTYVLADGDPDIVEVLNDKPGAQTAAPDGTRPPSRYGYMALKVLGYDGSGRIDRAIGWPVLCPPHEQPAPPGLDRADATSCTVHTAGAVRILARSPPPLLSYFLTWVSPTIRPPAAKP